MIDLYLLIIIYSNIHKYKKNNILIPINTNLSYKKCYLNLDYENIKIIHLVITRFVLDVFISYKIYTKDYILNGIRVMKKFLLTSLENQSCNDFIWILMIGNKANITFVKSLINLNVSFKYIIIKQKDMNNFIFNITKGFDVLISTRIDYDDIIYFDAVNDVRKAININKPMQLYGYNRGFYYFETIDKYFEYYRKNNNGVLGIFTSLIIVLDKVNRPYTIYDIGPHTHLRTNLIRNYKNYGIKQLNYEPAIFDSGDPKFVYVRQKYSTSYNNTLGIKELLKSKNFNSSKFYAFY